MLYTYRVSGYQVLRTLCGGPGLRSSLTLRQMIESVEIAQKTSIFVRSSLALVLCNATDSQDSTMWLDIWYSLGHKSLLSKRAGVLNNPPWVVGRLSWKLPELAAVARSIDLQLLSGCVK